MPSGVENERMSDVPVAATRSETTPKSTDVLVIRAVISVGANGAEVGKSV